MDLSKIEIYKGIFSDAGRAAITGEIRVFKERHGKNWLKEFKREFPDLVEIVDLIANHAETDAFLKFKELVNGEIENQVDSMFARIAAKTAIFAFLDTNREEVFKFHQAIREEIDRPRF